MGIKVKSSLGDTDELYNIISEFKKLNDRVKRIGVDLDEMKEQLKEFGMQEYIKYYQETGINPGTISVQVEVGDEVAEFSFVTSDRYTGGKTAEERDDIMNILGEDIIYKEKVRKLDEKLVDKYFDSFVNFILTSSDIDDEDRDSIIKEVETEMIKPGSINTISEYTDDIKEFFETVSPVVSIKSVKIS